MVKLVASIFLILFVLGAINGFQEGHFYSTIIGALATPLAISVPGLYLFWSYRRRRILLAAAVFWFSALVTLFVFTFYIVSGPSNPGTAGHMHIGLMPMLIFVASTLLSLLSFLGDWAWRTLNKSSKRDAVTRASS